MIKESELIHPNASEYDNFVERYTLINKIQIYYECENVSLENKDKSKKEYAVLLVHGWTANRLRLHPLYFHFVEKKIPVFRLDLRGHGWSQKEAINDFSIQKMSEDVELFIKQVIYEKFGFSSLILIGHSLGGSICMNVAASIPSYISKLILLATSAYWVDNLLGKFKLGLYLIYYKLNYWKKYNGKKLGHAIHGLEHFPMWSTMYNTDGRTLFTAREATLQSLSSMGSFDVRKEITKLKIPTLIIVGEDDVDAHPRFSHKIHNLIPNSTLIIIPGVNHDVCIGKPITLSKHIDKFIDEK